jgi:hypothetical protein
MVYHSSGFVAIRQTLLLPSVGKAGTNNGLPATAIVTTTLKGPESPAAQGSPVGGTRLPMSDHTGARR